MPDIYTAASEMMQALDRGPGDAATQRLARQYARVAADVERDSRAFLDSIEGQSLTVGQIARLRRYQALREQLGDTLSRYWVYAEGVIAEAQTEAIAAALADAEALTGLALPFQMGQLGVTFNRLPAEAMAAISGYTSAGTPLRELLDAYAKDAADKVAEELVRGVGLGRHPRVVAQRVASVAENVSFGWAEGVSRTAMLQSYRQAGVATYEANGVERGGVIKGMRRVASRQLRTCISCLLEDNKVTPVGMEHVRSHRGCRCTWTPITVSWRDLGLDIDEPVSERPSGREYFLGLKEAQQREVIGNDRIYDAYKSGKVKLDDLSRLHEDAVFGPGYYPVGSYRELERLGKVAA